MWNVGAAAYALGILPGQQRLPRPMYSRARPDFDPTADDVSEGWLDELDEDSYVPGSLSAMVQY